MSLHECGSESEMHDSTHGHHNISTLWGFDIISELFHSFICLSELHLSEPKARLTPAVSLKGVSCARLCITPSSCGLCSAVQHEVSFSLMLAIKHKY